jgi:WXG100 family type VII secretion target
MTTNVVSANYQELDKIAQQFAAQQQKIQQLTSSLMTTVDQLRQGGWVADSATVYYRRMDQQIFPSLRRLSAALGHSQAATLQIEGIFRQAEEEASARLRGEGAVAAGGLSTSQINPTQGFDISNRKPAPNEDGGWNGANPADAKAIVVNGMKTDYTGHLNMIKDVRAVLGDVPVMGVYNESAGPNTMSGKAIDIGQSILDKFQAEAGFRIGPENPAVSSLAEAILANDGKAPIIAYSQGGAITAAALQELSHTNFDLSKLTVITMGSAEFKFPPGVKVISLVNDRDPVPLLGGGQIQYMLNQAPINYVFDPISLEKHDMGGYLDQLQIQVADGL